MTPGTVKTWAGTSDTRAAPGPSRTTAGQAVRSRAVIIPLALVAGLGLGLRLWGIGFGLPYAYHFDETTYSAIALNLGQGIIGRQPNPTGFPNMLFLEYAAYFVAGRVVGLFPSSAAFEQLYRSDPSSFLLLARSTSALLGTLSIPVVYYLGREIRSHLTGLVSALFLAVAFLHVRDSHYAVPDVAAAFFAGLSVLLCVVSLRRPVGAHRYWTAASAGFAVATKWSTWPLVIPLALAILLGGRNHETHRRSRTLEMTLLLTSVAFLGGLLAGGFELFVQPARYLAYARQEWQVGQTGGFDIWMVDDVSGWFFYLRTLWLGLGTAIVVLAALGLVGHLAVAITKRDTGTWVLISFPLVYFILMGSTRHYFARYALVLVPFMAIFAASALTAGYERVAARWRSSAPVILPVFVLGVVIQPLALSIRHDVLLGREDTRTVAKQWIEATIPEGSKIALDWPVHGPPLSTAEKRVPGSDKTYQVAIVNGTGLSDHSLDWYREQQFDYLIASSFVYQIPLVRSELNAGRDAFYASLDSELKTARQFTPYTGSCPDRPAFDEIYGPMVDLWQRDRPGPVLKVYELR